MDARSFVIEHEAKIRPLYAESGEAWWALNTTGSEDDAERLRAVEEEVGRIYANAADFRRVRDWDDAGDVTGPRVARVIRLLRLTFEAQQKDEETIRREAELSTRVNLAFSRYRPRLRGREVGSAQIEEILKTSPEGEIRREAWEASQEIGAEVLTDVLELVDLRNRTAKSLGYRDYYAMHLAQDEIDEEELFRILDDLAERTAEPFATMKAELDAELSERLGVPVDDLKPWHYSDPFFQSVPPGGGVDLDAIFADQDLESLTVETYSGMGLNIRGLLERSDLYPRDGKCEHAFCAHIDREGDVRVLANIVPGERWMGTMLHEFGHAVYDRYISPDLPFLMRQPSHSLMTEAIALLMQRLVQDAHWLTKVGGVSAEEAEGLDGALKERARREKLIFFAWCQVMCRFERDLYGNPDLDRNARWWDLKEQYQGLKRPEGRDAPDWAAKIHIGVAPVYYQNYLLGELVASQLETWLRSVSSSGNLTGSRAVGRALVDRLFRSGAARPWPEALEHATGAPLDVAHFNNQYLTS